MAEGLAESGKQEDFGSYMYQDFQGSHRSLNGARQSPFSVE